MPETQNGSSQMTGVSTTGTLNQLVFYPYMMKESEWTVGNTFGVAWPRANLEA